MGIKKIGTCLIGVVLLLSAGFVNQSAAGVSVDVGIFAPPAYAFPAPPSVVVIPGTYVYTVPDANVNILFYHGNWWRSHEGRWYRSGHYNGSWSYVRHERVPGAIIGLPPDYRHNMTGQHIAHEDLNRNWRKWERDRYWDEHEGHQGEHGDHGYRQEGHMGGMH